MIRKRGKSQTWLYYTCAGLLSAGVLIRTPLTVEDAEMVAVALSLFCAWLVLLVCEPFISKALRGWPVCFLTLQAAIVTALLLLPVSNDADAVLFGVLAMYAVQHLRFWAGVAWVAVFIPLTAIPMALNYSPSQAATLAIIYTAVNLFFAGCGFANRRAQEARSVNHILSRNLEVANRELADYADKAGGLAVAQERNRLARELHDSVTQTIFSMTLAGQSAAILVQKDPPRSDAQLGRLADLAEAALAEMHMLVSQLAPVPAAQGGLVAALRRDIERRSSDGLTVRLLIDDRGPAEGPRMSLSIAEEQALLRIAQESLNNVVKHSDTSEAVIRLRLSPPSEMQIEDTGRGFRVERARTGLGIGLRSMGERAEEIGWSLEVVSVEGRGTRVIARRLPS